jgi:hypothetical protein
MRTYVLVSGAFFSLIALGQLIRAVLSVPMHVADVAIPVWCSYVAFVFLAALAVWAFRSARRVA